MADSLIDYGDMDMALEGVKVEAWSQELASMCWARH